jgi:hypothetical protein
MSPAARRLNFSREPTTLKLTPLMRQFDPCPGAAITRNLMNDLKDF